MGSDSFGKMLHGKGEVVMLGDVLEGMLRRKREKGMLWRNGKV